MRGRGQATAVRFTGPPPNEWGAAQCATGTTPGQT
jgi:hypothetical protein